jgi:hypothetical protein
MKSSVTLFFAIFFSSLALPSSAAWAQWIRIPGYGSGVSVVDSVVYDAQNTVIGRALGVRGSLEYDGLSSYRLEGIFEKEYPLQRMPESITVEARVLSGSGTLGVWAIQNGSMSGVSLDLQQGSGFASYSIPTSGLPMTGFTKIQLVMQANSSSGGSSSIVLVYRAIKLNYSDIGTVTLEGFGTLTGVEAAKTAPASFALMQNYPNPFNPSTTISYSMPQAGDVVLRIYDMLGRQVAALERGFQAAGSHKIAFDGSSLCSGTYVYVLRAGNFSAARAMSLLK